MTRNPNLDLIAEHGYPLQVGEQFAEILSHIDPTKVRSVLLTGAASRGELSYLEHTDDSASIEIYSEYEFMVIADSKVDPDDELRLKRAWRELEKNFSTCPLFRIDFRYMDTKSLSRLPHHLKHYETKAKGVTIYGEDLRGLLPEISLKTLDFKDLNEMLIWRLWAMLLYMPESLISRAQGSKDETRLYKYVLCRNTLDLLTWVLPTKGVLLPSFGQRADHLFYKLPALEDETFVDAGFAEFISECMLGKFQLEFKRDLPSLYCAVIGYFAKAVKYLVRGSDAHGLGKGDTDEASALPIWNSYKFFPDLSCRTKRKEVAFAAQNLARLGPLRAPWWIMTMKYGAMLRFLRDMHLAMAARLDHDDRCEGYLDRARSTLMSIRTDRRLKFEARGFEESWIELRLGFARFFIDYFKSVGARSEKIFSLLKRGE